MGEFACYGSNASASRGCGQGDNGHADESDVDAGLDDSSSSVGDAPAVNGSDIGIVVFTAGDDLSDTSASLAATRKMQLAESILGSVVLHYNNTWTNRTVGRNMPHFRDRSVYTPQRPRSQEGRFQCVLWSL